MYTSDTCPWCKKARSFLKNNKVMYVEVNLNKKPHYMNKVLENTGKKGVPQFEIDGEWLPGFDEKKLVKMLNLKNPQRASLPEKYKKTQEAKGSKQTKKIVKTKNKK